MRGALRARSKLAKLAAGAIVFAAAGGVAYAASGTAFVGRDGLITSCLPPRGGQVHIWKPGHRCTGGWVGITLDGGGATGATGVTGATGAANPDAMSVDGQAVAKVLLQLAAPGSGTAVRRSASATRAA